VKDAYILLILLYFCYVTRLYSTTHFFLTMSRIGADGEKLYLGQAAYNKNVKDAQIGNAKHSGTQGPVRAPAFFRANCR